jgi:putative ABC transport system permease protein
VLRGVLRKKILSDVFDNLGRTIQVVLIIAIGSVAVGSIMGSLELIQADIVTNWTQTSPASVGLSLGDGGINQELVDTMSKFREVDQLEAQFMTGIKWRRKPNDPWEPAVLRAREDYSDMRLYTLSLDEGNWPRNKIFTANRGYDLTAGDRVYVEINDRERLVEIGGVTWNINAPPPNFGGAPDFFTTKEHFADLTGLDGFGYVTASVPGEYSEDKAIDAATRLEDRIDGEGVEVFPGTVDDTKIVFPGKHPAQEPINGVFFILQAMAFAALILGLFLVFNTITAIISQQIPQIGVLKAIGATTGQILLLYYTVVLIYGLLAIIISIPLGALGAQGLRVFLIEFMGMNVGPFTVSLRAALIQIAICLAAPLLIATIPIFKGAGITVREAISSYGLTGGGGLLDRLMAKIAFIPRMTSMAVSNTFRNKMRVVLTQITLVGAGMLFIAVLSAQASIRFNFGPVLFDTLRTNILLAFEDVERFRAIETLTQQSDPAISETEMWADASGEMRPAGQPEAFDDRTVRVTGMPIPSNIYNPTVKKGRWLEPDDTFAIAIHQKEAAEIGVDVGDWVTFDIPLKRETDWLVVGLLNDPIDDRRIVVPRDALLLANRQVGRGNDLFVTTVGSNPQKDIAIATNLRRQFTAQGYELTASNADTLQELSDDVISQFNIIVILLLIMAFIIATVGGLALSGVLAINVLERRVEIGILRSIGASNSAIGTLFITEGVILGWLSWLIAVPLSIPFSQGLTTAVGLAVDTELAFEYSVISVWIWLAIITVLGIAASWFPSRSAIRVSVRESLSYE